MAEWLKIVIIAVVSYLLGSISAGLLVSRANHGPDLYKVGSGSTGTTNVMRTMGKKAGLLTFLLDFVKAILSCLLGWLLLGVTGARIGGLCCVLGHNWPVFFGFKGGKGVCSSLAVILFVALCCHPWVALAVYATGFIVMGVTRYVSLGSILGACVFFICMLIAHWGDWLVLLWAAVLTVLCVARHHANISRLLHGNENRIGQKKKEEQNNG